MALNTDLMFSSKTDVWSTPQDFFDRLHAVFRFETDVCALPENAKVPVYYTPEKNGLAQDWRGCCWMNPPYGREIGRWVEKAYRSAKENGATVVCLVPARVDTKWWHDFCANGEVFFVRGRLKFGGSANSAPFPCAVVVFRPIVEDAFVSVLRGNSPEIDFAGIEKAESDSQKGGYAETVSRCGDFAGK